MLPTDTVTELHGTRVFVCAQEGPALCGEADAVTLIGKLYGQDVDWVAIPTARLHADFFVPRTRVAGLFLQKLMNYRLRVAVVGDVSAHLRHSDALRDFVVESNRGAHVWFVESLDALAGRFAG